MFEVYVTDVTLKSNCSCFMYIYVMNRWKAKQMAFFACYINDIEIIDEVDQVDREAIDRDISPVARFKKDQWNCSDDFMKRNQCKKDALLD